jgi:hypothetical protein
MAQTVEEKIRELNATEATGISIPSMNGLNTGFAIKNKWIGYFPLANVLGKGYSNLELNVCRFNLPQMICGSTTVSYKAYSMEVPTKVIDAETKEITIEYIVDEKWQNYKALYLFASQTGIINPISPEVVDPPGVGNMIDCRIWLIDHFKNRIIDFVFKNAWIKVFQDLECDYASADEVHHSVTLAYSNFTIADANP